MSAHSAGSPWNASGVTPKKQRSPAKRTSASATSAIRSPRCGRSPAAARCAASSCAASVTRCVTGRVPISASSSNSSSNAGMNALYAATGISPSSSSLVCGDPYTAAFGKPRRTADVVDVRVREHEPAHGPVRGRRPRPRTAPIATRTMSVSTTVMPSSSTIAPALLTPDSPPGCSHTNTPSASSCSVRAGSVDHDGRPYPAPTAANRAVPRSSHHRIVKSSCVAQRPVDLTQHHVRGVERERARRRCAAAARRATASRTVAARRCRARA